MTLNELTRTMPFDQNAVDTATSFYKHTKPKGYATGIYHPDQMKELGEEMKKLGWVCDLTYGAYSYVFIKQGSPYILKINRQPDYGFARFALICRKYPNPHFPKIGNMKYQKIGRYRYYMYMIEKLDEVLENDEIENIAAFIQDYSNNLEWSAEDMLKEYRIQDSQYFDKELITACQILGKHAAPSGIDIHGGNLMMRGNTVIINDPYVGPYSRH